MNEVHWQHEQLAGCLVVKPVGILDAPRYRGVRDTMIKFALDQPRAVIVVIAALDLPDPNALTAFPSAALRVSDWPGMPIVVVTGRVEQRALLDGTRASRFVSVFSDIAATVGAARQPARRLLAASELSDGSTGVSACGSSPTGHAWGRLPRFGAGKVVWAVLRTPERAVWLRHQRRDRTQRWRPSPACFAWAALPLGAVARTATLAHRSGSASRGR